MVASRLKSVTFCNLLQNYIRLFLYLNKITSHYFIIIISLLQSTAYDDRLAQWSEYSPIVQEVAGSILAQYKHLCA
jgi:hypothetical protein